jgi:hypothetical protein
MVNKALKREAGLAAFLFQFVLVAPRPLSLVVVTEKNDEIYSTG